MQLIKFVTQDDPTPAVGLMEQNAITPIGRGERALSEILHATDVAGRIRERVTAAGATLSRDAVRLLAPLDSQEVWGAGVTYERSKVAREEESERAASFYDLVYRAARPELFFKATPSRVVGPGMAVRVRRDSKWTVPEPELALVLNPRLDLVGFSIGNDMSARDIEGANPLYLPQAKMYEGCCAIGPCISLASAMPPRESITIRLAIERDGTCVFEGETTVARMARRFEDLIGWLGRDNCFPDGVILLTGTGIVPPDDFGLRADDLVKMKVDGIGTLTNPVVQG